MIFFSLFVAKIPPCQPPKLPPGVFVFEPFNTLEYPKNWSRTAVKGFDGQMAIYDLAEPKTCKIDRALVMKDGKKKYAFSRYLNQRLINYNKTVILQYEYRFPRYLSLSSGYIKLYDEFSGFHPNNLSEKTTPTLIFGPEFKYFSGKIHLKFVYQNKLSRVYEEHVLKNPPAIYLDGLNHLLTLMLKPDETFTIFYDGEPYFNGSLLTDFEPPFGGHEIIPDPDDIKPKDWDEREMIVDETAVKPADWDDNAKPVIKDPSTQPPEGWLVDEQPFIPDPSATKPKDWDDNLFGEFIPPIIPNPKCHAPGVVGCGHWEPSYIKNPNYRGIWKKPLIKNPNYKGKWVQKRIPNKYHYKPSNPHFMPPITGIGFELWTQDGGLAFKNVLLKTGEEGLNETFFHNFKLRKEYQRNPPDYDPKVDEHTMEDLNTLFGHRHHHH
ncbi:Calreticulin family protein [Trichomonas vaginalis G3]|uniref:Calreticulin family protein n=1 Tax=Trichomonas vaginalis (strain ATCC PRA-98 / G3) TaxID=412133 RepID=A2FEE6_TRIV3|nr:unfolded protein binding [Trichomonas vaginalis G3]EAX96733.1 Calreticulin family protein [Trichomonas vaginalis G3]KAI5521747.1 unfolded protein binding [Trichomonas vaginalis G3]|eukprot:XP_001309663.1 Calreticulin family protein [Trichomonas vaginalis G3]